MKRIALTAIIIAAAVLAQGCAVTTEEFIKDSESHEYSPCQDPKYQSLQSQPIDALTAREFELLKVFEQACRDHKSRSVSSAQIAGTTQYVGTVILSIYVATVIAGITAWVASSSSK